MKEQQPTVASTELLLTVRTKFLGVASEEAVV